MNILLVDDNQYVLDGLLDGIDFQSLGISRVFTALNARKAKEQMQEQSIEVVITDIEMPNGSGLDLLAWINENYPQTVTLFCTSFADFNYAQEAVRLKCFDYYVKPIRYQEFEEHVKNAIQEVHKREQSRKVQEYGQYWMDNQWSLKQSFWYRYLYSLEDYIAEELQEEIEEQKLGYRVEQPVSICVIKMGDDERLQTIRSGDKNFIFKNISMEIFQKEHYEPEAILLTHGHYDHILAVPKLQERWKEIPVYCNAKDIPESLTEYDMGQQFPTVRAFKNVKTIEDGQELVIAGTEITVMETPGHTPGSVLFLTKDAIFTGDTIFQGSIGRTDFEGGNERQMMQSLRKINNLAIEDITLCPGHGDTTTLKWERAHNSYLKMCR